MDRQRQRNRYPFIMELAICFSVTDGSFGHSTFPSSHLFNLLEFGTEIGMLTIYLVNVISIFSDPINIQCLLSTRLCGENMREQSRLCLSDALCNDQRDKRRYNPYTTFKSLLVQCCVATSYLQLFTFKLIKQNEMFRPPVALATFQVLINCLHRKFYD